MKAHARRMATALVIVMLTLGLLAPAASARSCVAQAVEFERELFGTDFGRFVSEVARNTEQFGFSNFGELVSFTATSPHDECPEFEG